MSTPVKHLDLSILPPEYRVMFEAQAARVAELEETNQRQEHPPLVVCGQTAAFGLAGQWMAELHHALYGKKSEKLTDDDRQLAFEDLEVALAEIEEKKSEQGPEDDKKRKKIANRNRGNLPEGLPRIEQVIEPDSLDCPCGCGVMHRIGEDRTERVDIVPAQLRVIVTILPKYACRVCTDGVTQAPTPPWLIEAGLPTEGAIAHILVSKYADHLPIYRQPQILARSGIDIHRSTLADWVGDSRAPVVQHAPMAVWSREGRRPATSKR